MARKLKVYGWQGFRIEAGKAARNHRNQTREIAAATSMAACARAAGENSPRKLFGLCETGNDEECELALAEPGVVFWRPLDQPLKERKWRKA
jgi:hypothetical protein